MFCNFFLPFRQTNIRLDAVQNVSFRIPELHLCRRTLLTISTTSRLFSAIADATLQPASFPRAKNSQSTKKQPRIHHTYWVKFWFKTSVIQKERLLGIYRKSNARLGESKNQLIFTQGRSLEVSKTTKCSRTSWLENSAAKRLNIRWIEK